MGKLVSDVWFDLQHTCEKIVFLKIIFWNLAVISSKSEIWEISKNKNRSEYQKTHFRFENSNRDISATLWVKMSGESALESWDIKLFEKWKMRIYTYPTCVEYSKYAFKAIFQKEKVKIGTFRATSWHYDWFSCINGCLRCLEACEK